VEEWTTETALERKLLVEGFTRWKEAIDILKSDLCIGDKNEEVISGAIETAYGANEKLVMAQELTVYVRDMLAKKTAPAEIK